MHCVCCGLLRFDDEGQEDLSDCGVYADPEYNVLWSCSPEGNRMSCFNPISTSIDGMCYVRDGISECGSPGGRLFGPNIETHWSPSD